MDPAAFAAKWIGSQRTERAASQEHFIDLCRMLGQPTPNEADANGDWCAFEKGADKLSGGDGFADVWKRGHFGWEYKGKRKDLVAAYKQLNDYREALENPPILVVCDLNRFEVHTNFTGTVKQVHEFTLTDLAADPAEPLRVLRAVMAEPIALRPQQTPEGLTEQAGLVEAYTNADGKEAYRLTPKGAQLGRSMALAGDEDAAVVLDALLDALLDAAEARRLGLDSRFCGGSRRRGG